MRLGGMRLIWRTSSPLEYGATRFLVKGRWASQMLNSSYALPTRSSNQVKYSNSGSIERSGLKDINYRYPHKVSDGAARCDLHRPCTEIQ